MRGLELGDRLGEIRIPTLVVHGRHDYIPPRVGEVLQHGIPGSRLAIMEQSGHLPFFDEREKYFALLEAFLQEVEGTGQTS